MENRNSCDYDEESKHVKKCLRLAHLRENMSKNVCDWPIWEICFVLFEVLLGKTWYSLHNLHCLFKFCHEVTWVSFSVMRKTCLKQGRSFTLKVLQVGSNMAAQKLFRFKNLINDPWLWHFIFIKPLTYVLRNLFQLQKFAM